MRIAFFSDIHGNLPALEAALADAAERGATHLICLGDIVGYGPQPIECLQKIRQVASGTVIGNHDAAVCGLFDSNRFNSFARETAERVMMMLSPDDIGWLKALPYQLENDAFICTHGSFNEPEAFDYLSEREDAALSFALYPNNYLFFVGHTHIACVFVQEQNETLPRKLPPEDFIVQEGIRYLINPGTIGFPRGDSLTADYVLFDTVTRRITFRCVEYDMAPYRLALVNNGYNLLNYWFLSPKASRRRTELAMRAIATRRVIFDEKSGFSLQRSSNNKWVLVVFYIITALLLLFMGVIVYLVIQNNSETQKDQDVTKDKENVVQQANFNGEEKPPSSQSLVGPTEQWKVESQGKCRFSIEETTLIFSKLSKDACPFVAESPRIPLERFGKLTRCYKISHQSVSKESVDYEIRCTYFRKNGSSKKGGRHEYKTKNAHAYHDKLKDDFVEVSIQIKGTLTSDLKLEAFSITPVER